MASYTEETPWHTGETEMHHRLHVPHGENPTSPFLTPYAANQLQRSPLLALGTLDSAGRPWTTIWGGEAGFSRAITQSIIGVKTTVDRQYDPVVETLLGASADGEVVREDGPGRMVSGLTLDLQTRSRVKLYGRMVAGALQATEEGVGEVQLVVKIEQSLGNCPKYMNKKVIVSHLPQPKLVSRAFPIPQAAVDLLAKADLFFISSSNHESDMDTNHRGGPPGFVRILSNDENGLTLVYPEYSGNRLYQTLGNLTTTPQAGLVIPDFNTGNVLYVTGRTEILAGKAASELMSHTNLAIKIHVEEVRFVSDGLAIRGIEGEFSPYNPTVRYLSTEESMGIKKNDKQIIAKLIDRQNLTPSIARFRFRVTDPERKARWSPGQYVALSFEDELDIGYSHMRDDDPKSLNDDYMRTFTVSSRQGELDGDDQFEITIRKVGKVTDFMFRHNIRSALEVPLMGFGGEFVIQQNDGENVSFIAGGVGITPLLAQAADLELKRLRLYWTVRRDDLGLVLDTFDRIPELAQSTTLFVTGVDSQTKLGKMEKLEGSGAILKKRRMMREDFIDDSAVRYYLCTGTTFRKALIEWLSGKTVLYEDFNY